jgi:23S rRNA (cytidine1920-2'-O)/16S rRNA (cytidine1409-2'-O)-methyltransferase
MRLDQFLVQFKNIESRTKAQDLIADGLVSVNGKVTTKPSVRVEQSDMVLIADNNLDQYVSRAGFKLAGALLKTNQRVDNLKILDVGQSTGGFTDCLLQAGVLHVTGIDVGHGQLHEKIKSDSRVQFFENLNVKDLSQHPVSKQQFDGIVCDVSFISLTKVVPFLEPLLKTKGFFLFLVKPQFECGPEYLDKNGIVSDSNVYASIQARVTSLCEKTFNCSAEFFESSITGKDGNKEFFIYGKKN